MINYIKFTPNNILLSNTICNLRWFSVRTLIDAKSYAVLKTPFSSSAEPNPSFSEQFLENHGFLYDKNVSCFGCSYMLLTKSQAILFSFYCCYGLIMPSLIVKNELCFF